MVNGQKNRHALLMSQNKLLFSQVGANHLKAIQNPILFPVQILVFHRLIVMVLVNILFCRGLLVLALVTFPPSPKAVITPLLVLTITYQLDKHAQHQKKMIQ